MERLRIDLSYDGTDFAGWAVQPGQRTVQGTVEQALAVALRLPEPARLTAAGRTDAGVHARGQVAHADVPAAALARADRLGRRLRGLLPGDIRLLSMQRAPAGFDARFSALSRRYAYRVCDDPAGPDPLRRREVLAHPRPLDLAAMTHAAEGLLGTHDFASFCRRRAGATTVRRLLVLTWQRDVDGLAVARVEADAFCHGMVRSLVGALLAVGDGRRPAGFVSEVLAAERRDPRVTVAAPHGLTLEAVGYPPDDELAARARTTRALRTGEPSG